MNFGRLPVPTQTRPATILYRRTLPCPSFRFLSSNSLSAPRFLRPGFWLATWAKMAAASRDDDAANRGAAAIARLAFAAVNAMAALIFTRLAGGVKEVGDRRSTHGDGMTQNLLQCVAQFLSLFGAQR